MDRVVLAVPEGRLPAFPADSPRVLVVRLAGPPDLLEWTSPEKGGGPKLSDSLSGTLEVSGR